MNIIKYASQEKLILLRKKQQILQSLQTLPDGYLAINKNGSRYKWYKVIQSDSGNTRTYLKKTEIELARRLALKKTLEKQLEYIERQLSLLCSFINQYPSRDYLTPQEFLSDKVLKDSFTLAALNKKQAIDSWSAENYEKSTEYPESLNVKTKSGLFVRSKSEKIIADELYDNNIPFRYEQALLLGDIKVFPDFTILNPAALPNTIIWEHFGLMDSPGYVNNFKLKLGTYLDAAFIPGYNLITTFESRKNPLDSEYVSLLIGYYFS